MSVQEMKVQICQLVEHTDNELALEQILQQARELISDQPEGDILNDLTPEQLAGLELSRQEGREGKYTTLVDFKREVGQWLKSA